MIHDEGEGTVKGGPFNKANIKYHFAPYDIDRLKRGMVIVAEAYFKEGAAGVVPGIKGMGIKKNMTEFKSAVAQVKGAAQLHLYASHPQSTVRIHADPKLGPVSPKFNLHGMKNVFVSDASIFPDCLGVNPQITIMAASRLAATYVSEAIG
ncbi:MAG: hypothetical protein H0X01_09455 [Nitrospira sp.]|nr:hypothetical protein [Nitrospira sp.]